MKKEIDFSKGKRGPIVRTPKGKTKIQLNIDTDILNWFRDIVEKQGSGSYQTMINDALKEYIKNEKIMEEQLLIYLRIEKKKCKLRNKLKQKTMEEQILIYLRIEKKECKVIEQLKRWHKNSESPRNVFIGEKKK